MPDTNPRASVRLVVHPNPSGNKEPSKVLPVNPADFGTIIPLAPTTGTIFGELVSLSMLIK